MWTHDIAPVFDTDITDGQIMPNQNWNTLVKFAREDIYKPFEKLGYFVASVAAQSGEFTDLDDIESSFIAATEPPMTRTEKRQFQAAFGRLWCLEDAFVQTANQVQDSLRERVAK